MHPYPLIQDLAVISALAGLVSLVFHRIRQPLVLGYLVAGIIAGPYTPPFSLVLDADGIRVWAELGMIFLMFALGLEFSLRQLRGAGRVALITGPFEALGMLGLGYGAGWWMGWPMADRLFLGAILSISSTTIIVKALEELGLKQSRLAGTLFGVLVIEDLVGVLILAGLSTLGSGEGSGGALLRIAVRLLLVLVAWVTVGAWLIPRFIDYAGRRARDETLLLISLALCLGLVVSMAYLGFSAALGAFVMGSTLGESRLSERIGHLLAPVRDWFGAVFFVSIGMLLDPRDLLAEWPLILGVLILGVLILVLVGKILVTSLGARLAGTSWRRALQAGLGLAQIGEFSFIIAGLGLSLGVMRRELYTVAVCVSVLTTFTTPYLIRASLALAPEPLPAPVPVPGPAPRPA